MSDMNRPIRAEEIRTVEESQVTQPVAITREGEQIVVPLVEEYLDVSKQWVQSGEVIVRKSVETSTQTIPVDIAYEEVQVDRVPVNRALAQGEATEPWWDGDVMVVPVIEEELVVMKRQILKEELRIYKRRLSRQETVSDTIRSQQVRIETTGNLQSLSGSEE